VVFVVVFDQGYTVKVSCLVSFRFVVHVIEHWVLYYTFIYSDPMHVVIIS
jgi:hypothetical protein